LRVGRTVSVQPTVTNGTFHLSCTRAKVRSWPPRPKPNITVCSATCRKTSATAKSTAVRARRKLTFAYAATDSTIVRLAGRRAGTECRIKVRKGASVRERSREAAPECGPRRKPWVSDSKRRKAPAAKGTCLVHLNLPDATKSISFLSPLRGCEHQSRRTTAYALGYILAPLRGLRDPGVL
jgi:hypothetical protein